MLDNPEPEYHKCSIGIFRIVRGNMCYELYANNRFICKRNDYASCYKYMMSEFWPLESPYL